MVCDFSWVDIDFHSFRARVDRVYDCRLQTSMWRCTFGMKKNDFSRLYADDVKNPIRRFMGRHKMHSHSRSRNAVDEENKSKLFI